MNPIPYGRQNITEDDIAAVAEALRSDYLTQGPRIAEFEQAFAEYVGAPAAVAVSNATAGLHLAAKALDVRPGQKVIVTPLTFAASANCIRYCGGDVTFCDIDPDTYLLDLDKLEEMLAGNPPGTFAGVVVVDLAGYPVDGRRLRDIADRHGLWIIEDACHAPGAYRIYDEEDGNRHISRTGDCKYADATVFSFHPVKHIATGEGGMVTASRPEIIERLRLYRTHGITKDPEKLEKNDGGWYYEMQTLGFNYRLTDIQAALGLSQLKRAGEGLRRRNEIAERYDRELSDIEGIKTPFRENDIFHAFHLYIIRTERRKELYDYLHSRGILVQIHYVPLHLMPYYKELGSHRGDCPEVEKYYEECLSLPMFPTLTDDDQTRVISAIHDFFGKSYKY